MQNSAVSGGNSDADKPAMSKGNLLIRNDLTRVVSCTFSFRNVALANMSNEARIKSRIVVRISPYSKCKLNLQQHFIYLPGIGYGDMHIWRCHQPTVCPQAI